VKTARRDSNKFELSSKIDFNQEKNDSTSQCSSSSSGSIPFDHFITSNLNTCKNRNRKSSSNLAGSLKANSKPLLKDNNRSLSLDDLLSDLTNRNESNTNKYKTSKKTSNQNSDENLPNLKIQLSPDKTSSSHNTEKIKNNATNVKEVIVYSNQLLDNRSKSSSSSFSRISQSNLDQNLNNSSKQQIKNQFVCSYSGFNYNILPNHLLSNQKVLSPSTKQEPNFANKSNEPHIFDSIEYIDQIDSRCFSLEYYLSKKVPKQRLEIDILPSHLSSSQNKLLIASSFGKIRS
jgi:hypothetical protein